MTSEITSKLGLQTTDQGGIAGGAGTQKSKDENLKLAQQFRDLAVTSRKVVWLLLEQLRLDFVPVLHRLQGRPAAQG